MEDGFDAARGSIAGASFRLWRRTVVTQLAYLSILLAIASHGAHAEQWSILFVPYYLQAMIVAGRPATAEPAALPRFRLFPAIVMFAAFLLLAIALQSGPIYFGLLTSIEAELLALPLAVALGLGLTGPWAVSRILPGVRHRLHGFTWRAWRMLLGGVALLMPSIFIFFGTSLLVERTDLPPLLPEAIAGYLDLLAFLIAAVVLLRGQGMTPPSTEPPSLRTSRPRV